MYLSLLKKYFENRCSPEEAKEVMRWIEQVDALHDLDDEFKEIWESIKVKTGDYSMWSENLKKVHDQIEMETIYGSLDLDRTKNGQKKLRDRLPVRKVMYKVYSNRGNRKFPVLGLLAVMIIFAISIFYLLHPHKLPNEVSEITQVIKNTEPGQKLTFHLEDGTRVIMNSGSSIAYPMSFDSLERKVYLKGEAFFEVAKNTDRPFIVIADSVETIALGTSFNINTLTVKNSIEVALVSGQVSVRHLAKSGSSHRLLLNPGEMATVSKKNITLRKSPFDFVEKIAWKDGVIFFRDAGYTEIIQTLENWYGVKIIVNQDPTKKWRFSGRFENEALYNILVALQFGHEFEFNINGKNVKLNF